MSMTVDIDQSEAWLFAPYCTSHLGLDLKKLLYFRYPSSSALCSNLGLPVKLAGLLTHLSQSEALEYPMFDVLKILT